MTNPTFGLKAFFLGAMGITMSASVFAQQIPKSDLPPDFATNPAPFELTEPIRLSSYREGMTADVIRQERQERPPQSPNEAVMQLVSYPGELGDMYAYLTNLPEGEDQHPAIIWVSGGNMAIGNFWYQAPRGNDQTAAAFREQGVITMYPALRGLNGNPGYVEGYFGELDDLVSATEWLKAQPSVDPDRVYLGGHSTGGTIVLLAAAYADDWAGVFSFGPVTNPRDYGPPYAPPIARSNVRGAHARTPIQWINTITTSTFVLEGSLDGNADDLMRISRANRNAQLTVSEIGGCDHFSVLRPASELIAAAIVADDLETLKQPKAFAGICQ